ncbi:MAG: hypothetical protein ACRD3M_15625 [Thermoanaerobaculia bacterium]
MLAAELDIVIDERCAGSTRSRERRVPMTKKRLSAEAIEAWVGIPSRIEKGIRGLKEDDLDLRGGWHCGFGPVFAWSGMLVALLLLGFNIATFPTAPGDAGLVDLGPAVALWYVAVSI